mmetsp:Transcript_176725/g.566782  ORF Transcript_176725/g.566782 Transcript_176725/m.566782 type:complete len:204 (+) Transcript_176725:2524-3135(+)
MARARHATKGNQTIRRALCQWRVPLCDSRRRRCTPSTPQLRSLDSTSIKRKCSQTVSSRRVSGPASVGEEPGKRRTSRTNWRRTSTTEIQSAQSRGPCTRRRPRRPQLPLAVVPPPKTSSWPHGRPRPPWVAHPGQRLGPPPAEGPPCRPRGRQRAAVVFLSGEPTPLHFQSVRGQSLQLRPRGPPRMQRERPRRSMPGSPRI